MIYKHIFPNSLSLTPENSQGSKVSIITRTKNRPILLVRAIYSALAQTHQDWELIIVNDGGDRKEVEMLVARFASAFAGRLRLIHHETSKGMEAASNAGLKIATGDFVVIHDDDDSWYPDFLQDTVTYLNEPVHSNYAAVATNCTVIYEKIEGERVIETRRESWSYWKDYVDYKDLLNTNLFPPICLLIRKRVVDYLSGYNAQLPVLGDWDFNLRLIQVGDIGTINEPLAYYHHREVSNQPGSYGNSVVAGRSMHMEFNVKYRNSLMRAYATENPSAIGGIVTLIADLDAREKRLNERINHLEWLIGQTKQVTHVPANENYELRRAVEGINTALRVPRAIWRRMYPVRHWIARVRGRI
ncbi:glycosyltransferase family 2 protein [Brucella gallinifaecis]|uniref:glycosyltransferase family 2 protein n=1 Tax=Brucella gallinifaecis TaxID=215590 RepID=UPI00235F7A40|nr:glycosyltransferase family 2 protein [Brucella gallinifaecis]